MSESDSPDRWPACVRVPPFLPVPLRARRDGWTVARQGRFVRLLALRFRIAGTHGQCDHWDHSRGATCHHGSGLHGVLA